jgi:hypothetical protein
LNIMIKESPFWHVACVCSKVELSMLFALVAFPLFKNTQKPKTKQNNKPNKNTKTRKQSRATSHLLCYPENWQKTRRFVRLCAWGDPSTLPYITIVSPVIYNASKQTHKHTHKHTNTHKHTHAHARTRTHTHKHTHTHTHTHRDTHTQHEAQSTKHQARSTKHAAHNTQHEVQGTRHKA